MNADLQTLLACLLLLVAGMGALSHWQVRRVLSAELRRKLLHIGVGLSALGLPFLLHQPWMICVLLVAILAWLSAVRAWPWLHRRFGAVLHCARRRSHGEIWFAIALALLLLNPRGHGLLYIVPVLVLSLADACAAIVGRRFPWGALPAPAIGKTLAGSAAFFVVAWICVYLPLALAGSFEPPTVLALACLVAASATLAEAVCHRGLDNLLVPVVTFLVLVPFFPADTQPLLVKTELPDLRPLLW